MTKKEFDYIYSMWNKRLVELKWIHSPNYLRIQNIDFIKILKEVGKKPILVLDNNIFSRLIDIVSKGNTTEGNIQDIAILMMYSIVNDVGIMPYYALNELAETTCEVNAQTKFNIFDKIFTDIKPIEWMKLAFGFEKENKVLIKLEGNILKKENIFCDKSIDYLSNYAAILHLATILLTEKDSIERFKKYFEWFYNTLKVSRYTVVYICGLLSGKSDYKEPKKIHGKNLEKAINGCQNQARDLVYLTQLSIDRLPNQYEAILVTDDWMLGDIFSNGCFNTEPLKGFEKNIKKSSKKISKWVDELLANHQEIIVYDYESYCKEIVEKELRLFKDTFIKKNNL